MPQTYSNVRLLSGDQYSLKGGVPDPSFIGFHAEQREWGGVC